MPSEYKPCKECGTPCDHRATRCRACERKRVERPTTVACVVCGKEETGPRRAVTRRKTCSPECERKRRQETKRGEQNPQYKNGLWVGRSHTGWKPPYRPRKRVASSWGLVCKDESECRVCGGPAAHLHHVVPKSLSPGQARTDWRGNGIPLCANCHRGWHDRRVTIYREHLRPNEVEAAISYTNEAWLDRNYPKRNRDEEVDLVLEVGLQEAGERYETADLLDDTTGG